MNRYKASLIFLLFSAILNLNAQQQPQVPKTKIVIKELTKVKATGIILSETEMTRLVFDEIENLPNFDVRYLSKDDPVELMEDAQLIIDGDYELEANLITLRYQIMSLKPKMRFKQSVARVEFNTVKNEVLTNFLSLFPQITIFSEPSQAEIIVDGLKYGETPITLDNIINGEHLITVGKKGYFSSNIELLDVAKAETIQVTLAKQTMINEATPPEPVEGMEAIFNNIQYHKNVQNHPYYKNNALEGEVVVSVEVNKDGTITKVEIVKSFGDEALDSAAIDGVRSVRWKPSMLDDKPVEGKTLVKIKFKALR